MFSTTPGDRAVLVVTFLGVLFVEHLEVALILGVWLSLYFALRRAEGFKMRVMKFDAEGALREAPDGELRRSRRRSPCSTFKASSSSRRRMRCRASS